MGVLVGGWGELCSIFLDFFRFCKSPYAVYVCDKLLYNGYDSA